MNYNEPPKIMFEGEEFQRTRQSFQTPTPKIVKLIIKYSGGLIKDEKQANYVLIGLTVAAIIASLFLVFGGEKNKQQELPPMVLKEIEQMPVNK